MTRRDLKNTMNALKSGYRELYAQNIQLALGLARLHSILHDFEKDHAGEAAKDAVLTAITKFRQLQDHSWPAIEYAQFVTDETARDPQVQSSHGTYYVCHVFIYQHQHLLCK